MAEGGRVASGGFLEGSGEGVADGKGGGMGGLNRHITVYLSQ